jgi:hypothetical protein
MRLLVRFAIVVFFSSNLFAQNAALSGMVTDESGAIVPGAKITVTGAGAPRETLVGNDGMYSFANLAPGTYTVRASAPDLASEAAKIDVKPGTQALNLQLKIVTAAEQVTVEDRAVTVTPEPSNNASATVLAGDDLQALSENPDDLIAELIAIAGPSAGPGGASVFIDGFSTGQLASKESIREIRINQNPFSAEYDRVGTGRVEILTRPGTNQFHGTEFFNVGTDAWNSRNPFAGQKAPFLLRELGGNVSGPIGKRVSFFLDGRYDSTDNGAVIHGTTLDPVTLGIIDPFTDVFRIPQHRSSINPRMDYQLSSNNTLTVRYGLTHIDIPSAGIGGFNLISRGFQTTTTTHTVQATETAVFAENMVNEMRYQFFRSSNEVTPNTGGPAIQVLGAFGGGASAQGHSFDTQNNHELQDYVSILHGKHSWRVGARLRRQSDDNISPQNFQGTFTFSGGPAPVLDANNRPVVDAAGQPALTPITSIERYRRTLLFQKLGFAPSQIANLGGGASQFSINAGNPSLSLSQFDAGVFASDDWKINPALTMSLGLRYEAQTNIHDPRSVAPRAGLAWNFAPKTVARAGFGIFYDRFALSNTMTALRYNGIRQQQYTLTNPDFFPMIPSLPSLAAFQSTQVRQQVVPTLIAPTFYQSMISIERQLPRNTTLAVSFADSHGLHMVRSRDINAPLPGTYDPAVAGSGVYPFGPVGAVFLMESSGLYNQRQLIVNVNSRASRSLSLTGTYSFNHAQSNTDGVGTFPSSPYSMVGEYGPAATDVHHRLSLGGVINTKWNISFSPLVNITSGPPFDITAGSDLYGTTLFNGRPGVAADPNKPGVIQTAYGLLDPNPAPDEKILHRNYGRGPGTVFFNAHVGKAVRFGPKPPETGRGEARRPYALSFTMEMANLLNHTNPGPIIGNITSPLFGRANQPSGGGGFGGFSEAANNRRFEFQTRFTF